MKRSCYPFSIFALVLACGGDRDRADSLSRDRAAALVVDALVVPGERVVVLGAREPLTPGERIVAYHPHPELEGEVAITADAEAWFFWLDDEPGALFDHAGRYALVDRESGELTSIDTRWWPLRDGAPVWDDAAYASEADRVYVELGDTTASRAALAPDLSPMADCVPNGGVAVVVNGWAEGESLRKNFDDNGANMKDAFAAAGLETTYFGPEGSEGVDQTMTPSALANWFAEKATFLGPGDTLVLYVSGHGWVSETGRPGETQIGEIWETDLEKWLAAIDPAVSVVVMVEGCYSGGMVDRLSCVADLSVSATDAMRPSYGDIDFEDDPNPQDNGTEWTSSMLTCWNDLMESADSRAGVGGRAQAAKVDFFTQLVSECFDGAHELDEAELRGYTQPQKLAGAAKTAMPIDDPHTPTCVPPPVSCTDAEFDLLDPVFDWLRISDPEQLCSIFLELGFGNQTTLSTGDDTATAEGNVDGAYAFLGLDIPLLAPVACGENVVCANPKLAPDPDGVFVAALWLDGAIDQVPEHYYQYGFVFDQDGDPANNYQAAPPYPADFFDDTDLWIQLLGTPGQPWTVEVVDARDGGLVSVPTEVAVVIDDNLLLALIPSDLVANATDMRFTAFRHEGDYGASMPWSGDVAPPIDEPKLPMP